MEGQTLKSNRLIARTARSWPMLTIAVLAFIVILRLVFSYLIDLIPEEAYYWNYAQHLDIGYLDHPPMVAWLIWLSTSVLGNTEFAVRLPACLCWLIVAFFMFRLTMNLFDKATGYRSILLIAVLPIYFSIGFLMTPDAPLYAAWAGCLYFLERAFIANNRHAWWGVGICLGLGMLSKYTIGLLGLATVVFLLVDRPSRRWFFRPEPYLTVLLALVLFSPVLFWNFKHDWASFVFQGPRRWSGTVNFSLHLLVGGALVLLTPTGFIEAVRSLFSCKQPASPGCVQSGSFTRKLRFMLVFAAVPLLVFVINSLRSQPKLNWTGPIWLAILPVVAWNMSGHRGELVGWWTRLVRWSWLPTVVTLLALYAGGLSYIYLGMPGLPAQSGIPLPIAWEELSQKVDEIEDRVESETGREPLIIGMDKYWISSELSFYDEPDNDLIPEVGGQHLFGSESLMWDSWVSKQATLGRNVLVVSFNKQFLQKSWLTRHFLQVSKISTETIEKSPRIVGHFYWCVGYGYRK